MATVQLAMSEPFELLVEPLRVDRGGARILELPMLTLTSGEVVGVMGPSGSGKTTFLHVLARILEPDEGRVRWKDAYGAHRLRRRATVLVPQAFGLVASLTVAENVALAVKLRGTRVSERSAVVTEALEAVGLEGLGTRLVRELSGGQQQRVAVARALAVDSPVIIADEPTSELDPDNRLRILQLFAARAFSGRLVVLASHDPSVGEVAHRILELADGRLATDRWCPA